MKNEKTTAWQLYENGRNYNSRLTPNQYDLVKTNTEFFIGNQWLHVPDTPAMRGLYKPTFNIIKRIASLFIASLTSSGVALHFEPLAYYDGNNDAEDLRSTSLLNQNPRSASMKAADIANSEVANLLEKFKMEYRCRDALYDGAQTGDYCAHFYWDPTALAYGGAFGPYHGEIQMELVDGINVMFGNPNDRRVEAQPYILIVGRDTVENLRAEAERFKKSKPKSGKANSANEDLLASMFQPDNETEYQAGIGGQTELIPDEEGNGKCLYVYLYTKVTEEKKLLDASGSQVYEDETDENGDPVYEKDDAGEMILDANGQPVVKRRAAKQYVTSIHVTKAAKTAVIFEDVDTGLSRYPIAWGNWEHQKNQYHGRALVTGIIPNQIFINSTYALLMRYLQLAAFPKTVYNADLISAWTNDVGQAIGISGLQPGQGVNSVAYNLQPAQMSNQIFTALDKVMEYTKDCLGATDAQMGNVNPENTSALMVLQTNSEVPLENVRANLHEWYEDIGAILLDMMGPYYGNRPIVVERTFEEPMIGPGGMPVIDPMTGQMQTQQVSRKVKVEYDFRQLKHLYLNVGVNAGATTYYSEISMTQTLDNLRKDGTLDVIQYLERIPDKLIPRKSELISEIRKRMSAGTQMNAAAGAALPTSGASMPANSAGGAVQGGPLSRDKVIGSMPSNMQQQFGSLPTKAQNALVRSQSLKTD